MSKQLKGSLMVITAGIAWGISGVSGQYPDGSWGYWSIF